MSGIDCSVGDHISVSDGEDGTGPFVATSDMFRMRHRVRNKWSHLISLHTT
uniref:Uncharacterized protein n=1 Tax=Kryptolebias marmoratus TaxID=37003 RepID=A0A3Q3AAK1_KRYMA